MENKSKIELSDNKNIGNENDQDLEYWSNEFGISRDELVAAVKAGKTPAKAVEKYVKEVAFA